MGSTFKVCPICNERGAMERKLTRNKSGIRYDYEVFHHGDLVHWVRLNASASGGAKKGDTRKRLIEFLNSTRFRMAIFTLNDVVAEFEKNQISIERKRIRRDILKLAESGELSIVRNNRRVFFINSPSQERPDYIMKKVNITLEDGTDEGTFERHYFKIAILNDNEFQLHYIQFRATGDNERDRGQLSFNSYDMTRKEKAVIYFLEDDSQKKRILIVPRKPIQPGEERALSIEYFWPEIGPSYTFTAPTPLDFFQFALESRNDYELTVTRTNSGRTVTADESFQVFSIIRKDKLKVMRFEMKDLPAFAVLKFRWTRK